ncbi:hypothetical protein COCMIDRAFT_37545 [Bipolaris oryzae ATCC 44560]|uniref:Uncharacterized protein n=1 Tax=Bipolaris oryzae ATCC 44560 TaxID=930090 RepID=W6ZM27_COCMI|nr:uncharacterized protein COCMIDRAFT_37545 [Bipolaris oryzae ATCC 44560]EUC44641.1 hypothetical protein COCMIDRAFT_37545 [Bipolaris oryzae ATCC 44560]
MAGALFFTESYSSIQINKHSTAAMREVGKSPFMALPTELRCQTYSYLQEIVYEPIFPGPCMCKWDICRMPTALLQLNKTIYEELEHPSMQKLLQKANNQLLPKIVLYPTRNEMDAAYLALAHALHQVNIRFYRHFAAFATWAGCKTERFGRFVRQTLERMAIRRTCEIRFRILAHPLEVSGRGDESGDLMAYYATCGSIAALLGACRVQGVRGALGGQKDDEFTYLLSAYKREIVACLLWLACSDECLRERIHLYLVYFSNSSNPLLAAHVMVSIMVSHV